MKKFVSKALLFCLLAYALGWGVDFIISKGLLKMEDYRFQSWKEISTGEANSDLVILGNSRGLSHFEPWTISEKTGLSVYNLSIGGYAFNVQQLKYEYYLLHNDKPKIIVQQVDYYTMRTDAIPHNHQSEQYMPLIYERGIRGKLKECGYTWLDLNCPLYRYFGYQQVIKNGLLEALHLKHYVNDPSRRGHHYEKGEIDIERNEQLETIEAKMDPASQALFESFLAKCQAEGIKVILVNSPTYIGRTKKTNGLEEVNRYFEAVAEEYGAEYLNYENCELNEDASNFAAAVHLNEKGTHLFSLQFSEDIELIVE